MLMQHWRGCGIQKRRSFYTCKPKLSADLMSVSVFQGTMGGISWSPFCFTRLPLLVAMKILAINRSLPRNIVVNGRTIPTGIYKEPVDEPVKVHKLGLEGD